MAIKGNTVLITTGSPDLGLAFAGGFIKEYNKLIVFL